MGGTGDTRRGLRVLVLSFLLTALLRLQAEASSVQVDVHDKCFFEQGIMGNNMTLSFQVMEGGFLDLDVEVRDPSDDVLLLLSVRQTSGRYTFPVRLSGFHQFCFSNRMSTLIPKEVMLMIDPGQSPAASTGKEDECTNTLGEMVRELGAAIRTIKRAQQHMQVRQKTHQAVNANTKHTMTMWTFFQVIILVIMGFGQIYYLKHFFQAQRPRTQGNAAG